MTATSIRLRYVTYGSLTGVPYSFLTVAGAQRRAEILVGPRPKLDPDGYAVGPKGDCLFFTGITFEELFPHTRPAPLTLGGEGLILGEEAPFTARTDSTGRAFE